MKRVLSESLPLVTVGLVFLSASLPLFPLPLILPLLFLWLQKVVAAVPTNESAPRAYLMYFLMGLTGLVSEAGEIRQLTSLMTAAEEPSEMMSRLAEVMISRLPSTMMKTLSPLLCGVAVYIVFGGHGSSSSSPLNTSHLQQLNDLLQRARIPEAAASLMQELIVQTETIRSRSAEFGQTLGDAGHQIAASGIQAAASAEQFAKLAAQTAALASDMKIVRSKIAEMQADVGGVRQSVSEIGQVIDDFSEIAASRILNFSDETATSVRKAPHFRGPTGPKAAQTPQEPAHAE